MERNIFTQLTLLKLEQSHWELREILGTSMKVLLALFQAHLALDWLLFIDIGMERNIFIQPILQK
jgi:hypothetical protein